MCISHLLLLLKHVYAQVWNDGALPRVRSQGFLDNKPNPRAAELSGEASDLQWKQEEPVELKQTAQPERSRQLIWPAHLSRLAQLPRNI